MNGVLEKALIRTGFELCEFEPDKDEKCEKCGTVELNQLFYRSSGGYDSREGSYHCADCVIKEHKQNEDEHRALYKYWTSTVGR